MSFDEEMNEGQWMNVSNINAPIWLVKVPNSVAEGWLTGDCGIHFSVQSIGGKEQKLVGGLTPGGAAHRSGKVQIGDELLSIEGFSVLAKSLADVLKLLGGKAGTTVDCKFRRGEKEIFTVKLTRTCEGKEVGVFRFAENNEAVITPIALKKEEGGGGGGAAAAAGGGGGGEMGELRMVQNKEASNMFIFEESNDNREYNALGVVAVRWDMQTSEEYRKNAIEQKFTAERDKKKMRLEEEDINSTIKRDAGFLQLPTAFTAAERSARASEKRERMPEAELQKRMFALFGTVPMRTLKDLIEETNQPQPYIKDMLAKLCIYHGKGVFKGLYVLRGEYQTPEMRQKLKEENERRLDEQQLREEAHAERTRQFQQFDEEQKRMEKGNFDN